MRLELDGALQLVSSFVVFLRIDKISDAPQAVWLHRRC